MAATPKRLLHSIFANHTDVDWVKSSDKKQQIFSNQTYQCQIDNLVVELPFFSSTHFLLLSSIQHNEQFQEHYVFEVKEYFLPLAKLARKNFPHQQLSYYSMSTFLKNMLRAVEAVLVAEKELLQLKENKFSANNEDVIKKSKAHAQKNGKDNKIK